MDRKKVLLVDDSNTTLMLERLILSHSPYDIVTAKDGVEAVEKAKSEHPDVILMDLVMPKMNGLDACKQIRAVCDIPIIMVTTRGEPQNREAGYANGCSDYVTKPLNSVELLSKLRNVLGE
jgi:DNA-binding response OmpR family regulator